MLRSGHAGCARFSRTSARAAREDSILDHEAPRRSMTTRRPNTKTGPRPKRGHDGATGSKGTAPGQREGRLGAHDWIAAGQDLLREQGISAIKLAALTARLGVSTGSFYHHFTDFEQYLGALAESYSVERVMHDLESALKAGDHSPVGRIRSLGRQSLRAGTFELDRAMRIWATMDPRAEAALRRAEATVLGFITDAFAELGFERAEAALRARILLSTNVSPLLPQGEASRASFFRGCLRLMVAGAPKADAAVLAEAGLAWAPTGGQNSGSGASAAPGGAIPGPSGPAPGETAGTSAARRARSNPPHGRAAG